MAASAEQFAVEVIEALRHTMSVEGSRDAFAAAGAERAAKIGIGGELPEPADGRRRVLGRDQESVDPLADELGRPTGRGGDHRKAGRHRLHEAV